MEALLEALKSVSGVLGWVALCSIAIYLLAFVIAKLVNLVVDPVVKIGNMPVLSPVPIPTKNQPSPLHKVLVAIFEVRQWELSENWIYTHESHTFVFPKGFRFDGASIPRPFWAFLSPTGLLLIPGLIHDYGYKFDMLWELSPDGTITKHGENAGKKYWDQLFKNISHEVNGYMFVTFIAWLALDIAGFIAWRKHRSTNATATRPIKRLRRRLRGKISKSKFGY